MSEFTKRNVIINTKEKSINYLKEKNIMIEFIDKEKQNKIMSENAINNINTCNYLQKNNLDKSNQKMISIGPNSDQITINREQLYQTFILFHQFITLNQNMNKKEKKEFNKLNFPKQNDNNIIPLENRKDCYDDIPIKPTNGNFIELLEKKLAQENLSFNKNNKKERKINNNNFLKTKFKNDLNNQRKLNSSYALYLENKDNLEDNNMNSSGRSDKCLNFYNYNFDNFFTEGNNINNKIKRKNYSEFKEKTKRIFIDECLNNNDTKEDINIQNIQDSNNIAIVNKYNKEYNQPNIKNNIKEKDDKINYTNLNNLSHCKLKKDLEIMQKEIFLTNNNINKVLNVPKEKIISKKVKELNSEIIKFKEEKNKIIKLKNEYEKIQNRLILDISLFDQKKQEFEEYKKKQMSKLKKEKKYIMLENKNISTIKMQNNSLNIKIKKDKEKIEQLEKYINELKLIIKQKDKEIKEIKIKFQKLQRYKKFEDSKPDFRIYKIIKNKGRQARSNSNRIKNNLAENFYNTNKEIIKKSNVKLFRINNNLRNTKRALTHKIKYIEKRNNSSLNEKNFFSNYSSNNNSIFSKKSNLSLEINKNKNKRNKSNKKTNYKLIKSASTRQFNTFNKKISNIILNRNIKSKKLDGYKNIKCNDIKENNTNKKLFEKYDFKIDKKYLDTNTRLVNTIYSEGKIINIYIDNKKEIIFESGIKKIIFNDGHQIIYFTNGDLKQVYQNGKIVYYFHESKTIQTTLSDGTEIFRFKNGQIEKHFKNGNKEIFLPDGTKQYLYCKEYEVLDSPYINIQKVNKNN